PQGCSVEDSVSLIRATVDLSAPVVLACDFTLKWLDFETQVLQPAARRHFGRGVKRVDHMGGYACRPVAGTARLSQHAHGMAFDIAGFVLEDGRRVGVKQAWGGDTPAGRFLREIAAEGCRLFSLVLTPASDAAHHDHLHFELGPWRRCG
ncbi:MAG TPA: extensin family protein, partial [Alphaproteobacteria bacterium]|nr:extensin family protein [Alphaproteobacteria bacterium]